MHIVLPNAQYVCIAYSIAKQLTICNASANIKHVSLYKQTEDVQMKNKYISAFAIAVSFGLLVGCSNKTDDVISDNVQTQVVESSESVVETVETASQNESAETAETTESTPTTESVEVSKENESLNEVVSEQNEVVQEQTTVEDTTAEEVVEAEPTEQTTEQSTQPTQQSTSKSTSTRLRDYNIDVDHMWWCQLNDPSQLTEDEVTYITNKYPGFPKDPRQMTVEEFTAYMEAYASNQNNTYSNANTTSTTPTEDHEITQEDIAAAFAANGVTAAPLVGSERAAEIMDGWEIDWD